jgi:hypothetical protein
MLRVVHEGQTHHLLNLYQIPYNAPVPDGYSYFANEDTGSLFGPSFSLSTLTSFFLFDEPDNLIAQGLRDIFGKTGKPIISEINEAFGFQRSLHTGKTAPNIDPLGSVLRFKVKMRFVNQ